MSRRWWTGVLLGWLFLGCCVAWEWSDFVFFGAQSKILASIAADVSLGSRFWMRVSWFLAAVLMLHALFGLAIWLYARLLGRAFAWARRHPAWTLWICWSMFSILVHFSNTTWYPSSKYAEGEPLFPSLPRGPVAVTYLAAALAAVAVVAALRAVSTRGWRTVAQWRPSRSASIALIAVGALVAMAWVSQQLAAARAAPAQSQPNVFLIGMDSLRDDLPGAHSAESLTPNLDAFLATSARLTDTTTPLARTFGSWMAILSGRHPVTTNARINLMPRGLVDDRQSLPRLLKAHGYSTFYATDEVRFANIDQSYGFDRVVAPPIGATDFLLGKAGDLPLSNLVSPTWVARWLFPHSWANRAVYQTYRPEQFTMRLRRDLPAAAPAFGAIHLTLAHWPYNRAGQPRTRSRPLEVRAAYASAVREMDRQFGEVIELLERRGLLENALVVVLSDHGEGMGRPDDSMMREVTRIEERWGSMWGHGTSVMSPHQYQVVLAFRGYGPSRLPTAASRQTVPASLEDIAPTVTDFLGFAQPDGGFDGRSLAALLAGEADAAHAFADRIRFTETDFNTASVLQGKFDENAALAEGGLYYEVDPQSGWVQLKADRLGELYAQKERAAFSTRLLLAALPSQEGGQKYYLTDRRNHLPRLLQGRPDPLKSPEAARLWDALQARFPGELAPVSDPR